MADQATEATPANEQDQSQSTTGAPEGTSATQTTEAPDYFGDNFDPSTLHETARPAYEQMRADYSRKTQAVAEQRKQAEADMAFMESLRNPETLGQALAQIREAYGERFDEALGSSLGFEFEDDQEEQGEQPEFLTRAEWEQYQAQQQQRAAESQQEQYLTAADQHIGSEIARINATLKEQGRPELTDRQEKLVVKNAIVDTQPGHMPDVQSAFDEFAGVLDEGVVSWAATKTGGATTGGGSAATQVPDLDKERDRQDYMAERLQQLADRAGP